jgi:AcrR family transcriptional regulator
MDAAPRFFLLEGDPPSKQCILRAALKLFVRHGISGTSVRMIGEEAGYTNPALFKFFESKDALALYLFERCYVRLHAAVERAAREETFAAALEAVLDAFLDAMEEDLEAVVFVQDALRELWPRASAPVRARSILGALEALVERGRREGAVAGYRTSQVPVAAIVGLFAQFGRMIYFGEIPRPARQWRGDLMQAIRGMAKPSKR